MQHTLESPIKGEKEDGKRVRASGKGHLTWVLQDEYELWGMCYVLFIQYIFTDTLCLGLIWFRAPKNHLEPSPIQALSYWRYRH